MYVNLRDKKRLIVVGSVGFDHIMRMSRKFDEFILPDKLFNLNVSFTVDSFQKEYGGTGGNCCYGLGLLGVKSYLMSTFGKDSNEYVNHLSTAGVDISLSRTSESLLCAQGFVVSDAKENQIWGYYPGAMIENKKMSMKSVVKHSDLVAMLPNDPESYEKFIDELIELKLDYIFDPAFFIANLPVVSLVRGISHARIVIGNEYEIELLQRKTHTEIENWLDKGVVVITTKGKNGSLIQYGTAKQTVGAVKNLMIKDPTGAGDAYRAGFLAGIMAGETLEKSAQMGSIVSSFKLEQVGTQTYTFTQKEFESRLNNNY